MVQIVNYSKRTKLISGLSDSQTRLHESHPTDVDTQLRVTEGKREESGNGKTVVIAATRANTDSTASLYQDKAMINNLKKSGTPV